MFPYRHGAPAYRSSNAGAYCIALYLQICASLSESRRRAACLFWARRVPDEKRREALGVEKPRSDAAAVWRCSCEFGMQSEAAACRRARRAATGFLVSGLVVFSIDAFESSRTRGGIMRAKSGLFRKFRAIGNMWADGLIQLACFLFRSTDKSSASGRRREAGHESASALCGSNFVVPDALAILS